MNPALLSSLEDRARLLAIPASWEAGNVPSEGRFNMQETPQSRQYADRAGRHSRGMIFSSTLTRPAEAEVRRQPTSRGRTQMNAREIKRELERIITNDAEARFALAWLRIRSVMLTPSFAPPRALPRAQNP
jgi:hypothetical protein